MSDFSRERKLEISKNKFEKIKPELEIFFMGVG
jgi:hypothetical protein